MPPSEIFHADAIAILESNLHSYIQFSQTNDTESGILSGNNLTAIRSALIFRQDSSVHIRAGGNATRLTVLKNGKTGINIENPLAALHIKGIESTFDSHIRLETAGGGTDYANILYDGNMKFRTFTAGDEYQWRNSANNTNMTLQDDGDLFVDGTITASCGVLVCSDIRYKKNIRPLTNSLSNVLALHGIYYDWEKEKFSDKAFGDKRHSVFQRRH